MNTPPPPLTTDVICTWPLIGLPNKIWNAAQQQAIRQQQQQQKAKAEKQKAKNEAAVKAAHVASQAAAARETQKAQSEMPRLGSTEHDTFLRDSLRGLQWISNLQQLTGTNLQQANMGSLANLSGEVYD